MDIKNTKNIRPSCINALIHGESGVGKTTLARTLKGKTIIVSLESGLLALKDSDIDYVEVFTLEDLRATLIELATSNYDNIYIDSLTEIGHLFFENAKLKYPEDKQTMKLYGMQLESMTKFIKFCRDIKKNIFFTSLQKVVQDEVGKRYHTPDLQGSIATKCPAFFDLVFDYRVIEKDGKEHRVLITGKTDNSISKDRSNKLKQYEKPDLGNIIHKIFNSKGEK